ncbi:DNA repair protein complementing XP-C cells -like protein [Babesia sp. Xinjiang]|uniref:DNA repair protein complementing XP-C cells -like protein n=1 Tax=Babesia sp. Xinjiang TaxID=462227 RepID=UPI000A23C192|nr:DNA repair protein complementing XP-C cells -like protein [Babesia sp. Xinjiang]ORM39733.1 DNA repair protein complementing XP-C cells -like protein [Babesia sp. Xinjiang]
MRCLQRNKATPETLSMFFVCACRCYNIPARLVVGVLDPENAITLFAESFYANEGSWKRVDFRTATYDTNKYEPKKSSSPQNREREARYTAPAKSEYMGYLYIQRDNKIFVYKKGDALSVVAILVLRSVPVGRALLNTSEFPFEEEELRKRLVEDKNKPTAKEASREYIYVFGCNKDGWVSELTPKYVERYNDICIKRGKLLHEWLKLTIERLNEPLRTSSTSTLTSLLERAEAKWMETRVNNDPLPTAKVKFKNHPIYILASQVNIIILKIAITNQIGNNRIRKKDASPVAFLKGEEVYLRSDFEELKTAGAWRKLNRRVLEDAQPVTTRRMYNKITRMYINVSLFKESQTELIPQEEAQDGSIPTTAYDNVDVTGQRFLPQGTIYLRSRRPELLFRAAKALKLYYKPAFSTYLQTDVFKPDIDGIVIRKGDLAPLLHKYEALALEEAKRDLERRKDSYRNFWRSVFKTMLTEPPSVAQQHHRKIRKELGEHVTKFLNRLEHIS